MVSLGRESARDFGAAGPAFLARDVAGVWTKVDQDSRITGFTTIPRSTSATALLISSNR